MSNSKAAVSAVSFFILGIADLWGYYDFSEYLAPWQQDLYLGVGIAFLIFGFLDLLIAGAGRRTKQQLVGCLNCGMEHPTYWMKEGGFCDEKCYQEWNSRVEESVPKQPTAVVPPSDEVTLPSE